MTTLVRSIVPPTNFHTETIAPGVQLRRLYPGGKAGPNNEVANDIPGGQTWAENLVLGGPDDDFVMVVPDIRMPANQFWPMHWHDCWTVVVVLEGRCEIGDWYMEPGDVFVARPSIEYGPLVIGPSGCRLLEIFADGALSPGGYGPEYHDHPTLRWGNHVFTERADFNRHNAGNCSLSLDGAAGMWKTRLAPGLSWDLGEPGDLDRGVVRDLRLAAGETLAAHSRADWYGGLILEGSIAVGGRTLVKDDVFIAERNAPIPAIVAGSDGAHVLEHFRTARAL